MKKSIKVLLLAMLMPFLSNHLYAQEGGLKREFGLSVGGFTNFPVNKDFLKQNIKIAALAPYIRVGKHEFYAGILYPVSAKDNYGTQDLNALPGAIAGYKFYIFDIAGRENMFVNYSFQYLKLSGKSYGYFTNPNHAIHLDAVHSFINNSINLGYVLFLDQNQRFSFYYTFGYVISKFDYDRKLYYDPSLISLSKGSIFLNRLNNAFGFSFKLKSFDKKMSKTN